MIYVLNMDRDIIDTCSDWDDFDDRYGNCDCVTATDDEQDLIGNIHENGALLENKDE